MSAAITLSKLQAHKYAAQPLVALKRVRQWLAQALDAAPRWEQHATSELPATHPFGPCPAALPGRNQQWIAKTWAQSARQLVCSDGRLRLSGPETLDICVTPREGARSLRHFARCLDYLAADGIGVEIRKLDGWRTCAIVDGAAVPIRIRERMRRIPRGNWLNVMLERWLGGSIPTMLASSGRLELQLLRMGVAFASFPVEGEVTPSLMAALSRAIKDMAGRQVGYQQRMHAVAVAETTKRATAARRRSRRGGTALPEPKAEASERPMPDLMPPGVQAEALASLAALSALGSAQIRELVQAIEKLTEKPQDSLARREREMSESVASLARAMARPAPTPVPDREPGLVTAISSVEGGKGKNGRSTRGRRSPRVA